MIATGFQRNDFVEWGEAGQPIPGQAVSGDVCVFKSFEQGALVAVVDVLFLTSDSIRSGFGEGLNPLGDPQQIANGILSRHFKGNDDAQIPVVRYVGKPHE